MNTISALAALLLRSCPHAIREMLFGAAACLRSIPHKPLRRPALAEPAVWRRLHSKCHDWNHSGNEEIQRKQLRQKSAPQ